MKYKKLGLGLLTAVTGASLMMSASPAKADEKVEWACEDFKLVNPKLPDDHDCGPSGGTYTN